MNNYIKCSVYEGLHAVRERYEFFNDADPYDAQRAYEKVVAWQSWNGGQMSMWSMPRVPGEWDLLLRISES